MQPGVVPKAFFLGSNLEDYKDDPEFRTKAFNIDSAMNVEGHEASVGLASAVDRVRWEVTEKLLIARRSYQETPNADKKGLPRVEVDGKLEFQGPPNGTIVAAYEIEKHFDIRRGYNAATGEEQNTIEENDSDRPWQQRQYMRVNWSKNTALSTSGDTSWVFGGDVKANAVEYSATDEANKDDRPHFEVDNGYFDITNKYTVTPEPGNMWGVPDCVIQGALNGNTTFDCSAAEVKVRHSFVKMTGAEDFEPFEEEMAFLDVVGNWGNAGSTFNREYGGPPISAWDPQYGFTDAKTKTFYSIHELWEKSHLPVACNDNTDKDKDGTADACKDAATPSRGSQCDVNVGKCTIPVRDRKVKTIGYWLNAEAPPELADQVDGDNITEPGVYEELTGTWNQLLRVSIAYRREVECRRTAAPDARKTARETCHNEFFEGKGAASKMMVKFGGWGVDTPKDMAIDEGAQAMVTCHNPVRSYDASICGKPGEAIRLGDVRKNYQIYWPYASRAPYGGVATIGGDPLTGEMVAATATTMMRSATYGAAMQRDVIQLAIGDLKMEDLINGVQATRYVNSIKEGTIFGEMPGKPKSAAEMKRLIENAQASLEAVQAAAGEDPKALAAQPTQDRQIQTIRKQMMRSPQTASIAAANKEVLDLVSKLKNDSQFASSTGTKALLRLSAESKDKSTAIYNGIASMASRSAPEIQSMLDQYEASMGAKGVCFMDSSNQSVSGSIYLASLAKYFMDKYGKLSVTERGAKIYNDLLRESTKGIAFHEIGHSIGLRHNFASSWDSLNYAPQYWQLRTAEGKATAPCTAGRDGDTDSCIGPRYVDPVTADEAGKGSESRPAIEYFANTSTMEYQIERGGETVGAGTYDLHAMKTLYGRVLETFDPADVGADVPSNFGLKMLSQGISKDLVFNPKVKGFGLHYTNAAMMAKVFDPARDCRPATDEEKAAAKWRIVHGKVCSQSPRNHLAYEDMLSSEVSVKINGGNAKVGADGVRWKGVDENKTQLVRWPYRYGEDYSAGGYLHAKMFDSGADIYEITKNVINRFENQYPWAYFRRQNKEFAWWSVAPSIASGTFSRLRGYHWSAVTDISRATKADLTDVDQEQATVMAQAEMWNFLQRVVLTPEPGEYITGVNSAKATSPRPGAQKILDIRDEYSSADNSAATIGALGIVDGRFVQVDFDNARGGSWDYGNFASHAPFDDEKVLALGNLVNSVPTLSTISRENALDNRDVRISFRTDTPAAIDRLLGGILSEDWEAIGSSLVSAEGGEAPAVFSLMDPDPANLVRPNGSKGILFPNIGYSNELGAGVYALLFSRFSTDMVLAQKLRVRFEGDNAPTIPDDRKAAFTDPVTGHRYLATKYGTESIGGRPVEKGIASRMIERANDLAAAAYTTTGAPNAYGEHDITIVNGLPAVKDAVAEKELRRYIGLLDGMRQVGIWFGNGPLGGSGGGDDEE